MTPDAIAVRRSVFAGCRLPSGPKASAVALPFATRFVLRGGADVVEPLGAAFGVTPPLKPLSSASEGARAALWMGPDEWLLISDESVDELGPKLEAALAGVFHSLVDISHRQVALEVSGPGAARLLSATVPIDLDLSAFPVGMATRTLLLKAEIGIWRVEAERFRLEISRSFGPYVAAVLTSTAVDQEQS